MITMTWKKKSKTWKILSSELGMVEANIEISLKNTLELLIRKEK